MPRPNFPQWPEYRIKHYGTLIADGMDVQLSKLLTRNRGEFFYSAISMPTSYEDDCALWNAKLENAKLTLRDVVEHHNYDQ